MGEGILIFDISVFHKVTLTFDLCLFDRIEPLAIYSHYLMLCIRKFAVFHSAAANADMLMYSRNHCKKKKINTHPAAFFPYFVHG